MNKLYESETTTTTKSQTNYLWNLLCNNFFLRAQYCCLLPFYFSFGIYLLLLSLLLLLLLVLFISLCNENLKTVFIIFFFFCILFLHELFVFESSER